MDDVYRVGAWRLAVENLSLPMPMGSLAAAALALSTVYYVLYSIQSTCTDHVHVHVYSARVQYMTSTFNV